MEPTYRRPKLFLQLTLRLLTPSSKLPQRLGVKRTLCKRQVSFDRSLAWYSDVLLVPMESVSARGPSRLLEWHPEPYMLRQSSRAC